MHNNQAIATSLSCLFVAIQATCRSEAGAAILIPTNQNGADAEVREDPDNHMRPNTDPHGDLRDLAAETVVETGESVADASSLRHASRMRQPTRRTIARARCISSLISAASLQVT